MEKKPDLSKKELLVPWFLMASYTYYVFGVGIMPDKTYDKLTRDLLKHWDAIAHPHKHLITKDMLLASTGYNLEYPTIVKHSAVEYLKSLTMTQIVKYTSQKKRK